MASFDISNDARFETSLIIGLFRVHVCESKCDVLGMVISSTFI